jgi:hypothetical protein
MKKLCVASIAALLAISGAPLLATSASGANAKLSSAECQNLWGRANAAGSPELSIAEVGSYVPDFDKVDLDKNGSISSAEFTTGCNKGYVHDSAASGASEGSSGSSKRLPGEKY